MSDESVRADVELLEEFCRCVGGDFRLADLPDSVWLAPVLDLEPDEPTELSISITQAGKLREDNLLIADADGQLYLLGKATSDLQPVRRW